MRLSVSELADLVGGQVQGAGDIRLTGAEVDSRALGAGDLFVALPGERRDGHEFVGGALQHGSAALVRSDAELAPPVAGKALIRVADPLAAYHRLAAHERTRRSWQVAAVTGSVGKTTTKDFLAQILSPYFRTGASAANRNSTLGLPAQLLSQPEEIEILVAEAGMSRAGELDLLGQILRPTLLLYTRLAPVHTEFFASVQDVVRAKAELLAHLDPAGTLVLNHDDPHQQAFAEATAATVLRYSCDDGGDGAVFASLDAVDERGLLGSHFELVLGEHRTEVELKLPGAHQRENLLAAATAASALGLDAGQIAAVTADLQAAPHRGRIHHLAAGLTVVDDSYNASPVAMAKLLELLALVPGRRVAVLGEMYELGTLTRPAHRQVGAQAAAACDLLVSVGAQASRELTEAARAAGLAADAVHHVEDAAAATNLLERLLAPGDVVLLKGSRGVGLDRTVAALLGEEAS